MRVAPRRIDRRTARWLRPAAALLAAGCASVFALAGTSAPAAALGPVCTPATLDASALLDGAVTVSPMPGAADAAPSTQISFLGVPAASLLDVSVLGSRSGRHSGALKAYSQGDGASFVPSRPFTPGERVTVTGILARGSTRVPLRFAFTVAHVDVLSRVPEPRRALPAGSLQHFPSRPTLAPPRVKVAVDTPARAVGDVLLAPYGAIAQAGPMILDSDGGLVWFDPLGAPEVAADVRVQELGGAPVLTWWQGLITTHGFGLGADVIDDTHYRTIAEVRAGNGYQADLHEFQLTPQGTALLTAYSAVDCNLAGAGGAGESAVTDSLFQEVDVKTGLVEFEWTSLDHVPLSNTYSSAKGASTQWPLDFFHLNSVNLDPDGTLLISSRNTWAAYDINAQSGKVLWQLGGKASSFSEGRGAATAYQHDARPDGAGTYTLFDNGASPQVHAQSRGVVLSVNTAAGTVSVLAQFLHPGHPLVVDSQGDLQALPGGDWLVGWGQEPDFSEFSASGSLLLDASLPAGYQSYRTLNFAWEATPTSAPALAIRRRPDGSLAAYMSWNGATQVAAWQLLQGSSAAHLAPVGNVARSGFETVIALHASAGYAQVRALDSNGAVLGTSAAVALAGAPAL
ncbi:MAG TPA: arylsulfotransferase family protein [Solirubrobacteraceae bacterium]|jgi:hypothetical protein